VDRAEATGFGVAAAGHAVLLGVLSLGFANATRPPLMADPIEVAFVDEIGLKAAVTEASTEDPAEAQAPEAGPPEEAAPEPVPAPPEPTPTPPQPLPKAAVPEPKPQPKERPAKPAPAKAEEKKPAPSRPAPAKTAAAKPAESNAAGSGKQARASRIGSDFLKGLSDPSSGKAEKPRAAVSSRNMAGLVQAIREQVKPCYVVPTGGEDSDSIQTVLRLRFREDGSIATPPTVAEQSGITSSNRSYAKQMADAARRAVLRCAPLKLPADLYEGGWEDIEFVFNPRAMG
jgi:outer membrane biosynthesis protein TonB